MEERRNYGGVNSYLGTPPQHWGCRLEEGLKVPHAYLADKTHREAERDTQTNTQNHCRSG